MSRPLLDRFSDKYAMARAYEVNRTTVKRKSGMYWKWEAHNVQA